MMFDAIGLFVESLSRDKEKGLVDQKETIHLIAMGRRLFSLEGDGHGFYDGDEPLLLRLLTALAHCMITTIILIKKQHA